jgi:hypothetical protein
MTQKQQRRIEKQKKFSNPRKDGQEKWIKRLIEKLEEGSSE